MYNHSDRWRPGASQEMLRLRATMLAGVREFFSRRSVLEVETPVLSHCTGTDPALTSPKTKLAGIRTPLYLQTSPEFHMKRLLSAGCGDIYQISRVFRDGEAGSTHNPEFTMIEWYRHDRDYKELAGEVCELIALSLGRSNLATPERLTYREALARHAGLHDEACERDALVDALSRAVVDTPADLDIAGLQDLLFSTVVIPQLAPDRTTVVCDFPAEQSALARLHDEDPTLAQRFEVFVGATELANGFQELADGDEQRRRFERELEDRNRTDAMICEIDERLIAALDHGLPDCAGVALGFDRLVMLAAGASRIAEVMAFDISIA